MHVARVYLRVSTQGQDLDRQESIIAEARDAGYYIAGVYREKASGARADRPELLRLIADLQPGEVVVAEKIDRISRLPLPEAEKLIETIRNKGARLAVPGVVDLSDIAASADGVAKIVLESIQEMLLKLAQQMARDDFEDRRERQRQGIELARAGGKYAGRQADLVTHERIIVFRSGGNSISRTAKLTGCSEAQVKRVWARHQGKREAGHAVAKVEFCACATVRCKTVALIGSFRDKGRSREVVFFRSFPRIGTRKKRHFLTFPRKKRHFATFVALLKSCPSRKGSSRP
jgi:DNA invertase Pin-like site-specific DNA recombinase